MKHLTFLIAIMLAAAVICGCSYVTPSARNLIAEHCGNAAEFDRRIQAAPLAEDPNAPLPAWVKAWSAEEARTWRAMVAWSKGQAVTPAPEPAE